MTGLMPPSPLSYSGQVAVPYINRTFAPVSSDLQFDIPTIWTNTTSGDSYILTSKALGVATWTLITNGSVGIQTITGNDAVAVDALGGNINVLGDEVFVSTSGDNFTATEVITGIPITVGTNNGAAVGSGNVLQIQVTPLDGTAVFTGSGNTVLIDFDPDNTNLGIGLNVLSSLAGATGSSVFGSTSAPLLTSGADNSIFGAASGSAMTTANQCTLIGSNTMRGMQTGTGTIAIGFLAGSTYTGAESGNILINNSGVNGENATTRIGTAQTSAFMAGIDGATVTGLQVLVSTAGQLGDVVSSKRFKENIKDISKKSILDLRPVQFNYKSDKEKTPCFGLIAEEVEEILPELIVYKDGAPYGIKYHEMPALLLNEIQKLKDEIKKLKKAA